MKQSGWKRWVAGLGVGVVTLTLGATALPASTTTTAATPAPTTLAPSPAQTRAVTLAQSLRGAGPITLDSVQAPDGTGTSISQGHDSHGKVDVLTMPFGTVGVMPDYVQVAMQGGTSVPIDEWALDPNGNVVSHKTVTAELGPVQSIAKPLAGGGLGKSRPAAYPPTQGDCLAAIGTLWCDVSINTPPGVVNTYYGPIVQALGSSGADAVGTWEQENQMFSTSGKQADSISIQLKPDFFIFKAYFTKCNFNWNWYGWSDVTWAYFVPVPPYDAWTRPNTTIPKASPVAAVPCQPKTFF